MVFRGDRIRELRNGTKMECDVCGKGIYLPCNKDAPVSQQTEFKCSYCDNEIHILPHFDNYDKPECLKSSRK